MPGNQVVYAYHFEKPTPDRKSGSADAEKRYYLTWRRGSLQEADRELLTRAGISTQGKIILKFLPQKTEQILAGLESAKAGARVKDVYQTRFGVKAEGGGFAFYVIDQTIAFGTNRGTD